MRPSRTTPAARPMRTPSRKAVRARGGGRRSESASQLIANERKTRTLAAPVGAVEPIHDSDPGAETGQRGTEGLGTGKSRIEGSARPAEIVGAQDPGILRGRIETVGDSGNELPF